MSNEAPTFDQVLTNTMANAMLKIIPALLEAELTPLRNEIRNLKSMLKTPYGVKQNFTIAEISNITGLSKSKVHKDINKNILVAYLPKSGNCKLIPTNEASKYIAQHTISNV